MSWVAIHVFAYQEVPTAANLNNNFANLNETSPGKVTTKADMTAATGANSIARLPGGSVRYWGPVTIPSESTGLKFQPLITLLDYNYASYLVTTTATETDTWSYSLAAGALGAREALRITFDCIFYNNYAASQSFIMRFYVGSTSYAYTSTARNAGTAEVPQRFTIFIRPANSISSQLVTIRYWDNSSGAEAQSSANGTDDYSTSKTLKCSIDLAAASASLWVRVYHPIIEVIPGMT